MEKKTVLVTGATGFLAGAFLDRMMSTAPEQRDRRFVLLARGASEEAARARILARLSRFRDEAEARLFLDDCQVICADLSKPDTLNHPLIDGVTHVVHLGANTSFISGQGVWETNKQGTIALARRLQRAPRLERVVYVGTAMICGDEPPHVVREDDYPAAEVKHLVDYTASKAAAEHALVHEFPDLPVVVARPSIVVGHTRLGCQPSGSIFWVFRALDEVGLISVDPSTTGLDVVPVDWVADGLVHLTFAPTLKHQTYHLSAGAGSRTDLLRLMESFAVARGRAHDPARFARIRSEDIRTQRKRLAETFGKVDGRRMELVLALYLHFCELDVTFDNARILAEGLPQPPPLSEYAAACLHNPAGLGIVEQAADEL